MKKPNLYKKESLSNLRNRDTKALSEADSERVELVVSKFFELFKSKYL